ncbi:MAG: hypothetical protein Ct9H90mP16_08100 [Candidatus Poseidoniales archaeon]|nr:MAG: hypothetical protein Ct9H90mP16_08100 [Candidatus Poseidoniales archaeon]
MGGTIPEIFPKQYTDNLPLVNRFHRDFLPTRLLAQIRKHRIPMCRNIVASPDRILRRHKSGYSTQYDCDHGNQKQHKGEVMQSPPLRIFFHKFITTGSVRIFFFGCFNVFFLRCSRPVSLPFRIDAPPDHSPSIMISSTSKSSRQMGSPLEPDTINLFVFLPKTLAYQIDTTCDWK